MSRLFATSWLAFVLVLLSFPLCALSQLLSIEQRFENLSKTEWLSEGLPDSERALLIGNKYDELFSEVNAEALKQVGDDDLDLWYRSADLAVTFTHRPSHVQDMELILSELQSKGLASKRHYIRMYGAYIKMRALVEARKFYQSYPAAELDLVPDLREVDMPRRGRPTELVVSPDKHELLRRPVDMGKPVQIVIVAHPLCHFSRDATLAILSDPVLADVFRHHAKWLAPVDPSFNFDVMRRWNQAHPGAVVTLAYKRDEWTMLDSWATPTFYFFKQGALIVKVVGWPKGGRNNELRAALHRVGLLPASK